VKVKYSLWVSVNTALCPIAGAGVVGVKTLGPEMYLIPAILALCKPCGTCALVPAGMYSAQSSLSLSLAFLRIPGSIATRAGLPLCSGWGSLRHILTVYFIYHSALVE
jgi:hypothetical protein